MILGAFVIAAGLLAVGAAQAVSPQYMQQIEEERRSAPVVVQLEVLEDPVLPREVDGSCGLTVAIRRVFRGEEHVRPGDVIRVLPLCERPLRPGEERPARVVGNQAYGPPAATYAKGRLLEARLHRVEATPPDFFVPAGHAIRPIEALTEAPASPISPADRPARLLPPETMETATRPLLFPARDVTVTFRTTARPGEEFQAAYLARSWRLRSVSLTAPENGATLMDAGFRTAAQVFDRSRSWRRLEQPEGARYGLTAAGTYGMRFTRLGEDRIAGHRCTRWRIEADWPRPIAETACVTADGVQLRREGPDGVTEVTRLEYGTLDPRQFRLPEGYRETR